MSEVLVKYFSPDSIKLAYNRVFCWSDKLVKDNVGLRAFGYNLDSNAEILSQKIISGGYKPERGFKFYTPKASYTNRTKTTLNVEDAIIYQAIVDKIGSTCFDMFNDLETVVFGSVLSPDVKKGTAILKEADPNFFFFKFWKNLFNDFKDSVIHSIEEDKAKFKFETDITGFFDCIPHYNLLEKLSTRFGVEDEILNLLSNCLNIWSGTKDSMTPGVGIPQGPAPSFFLANLVLHELDELIIDQGLKYYRYMDDIKIYGFDENKLIESLVLIDKHLKGNGLSINAKKTKIERIDEDKEDATVKELKKIAAFGIYDNDESTVSSIDFDYLIDQLDQQKFEPKKDKPKKIKVDKELKQVYNLSNQSQEVENDFELQPKNTLTDPIEIKQFWEKCIVEIEKELPEFFKDPESEMLELKEDIDDIDFIRTSAHYSNSVRALQNINEKPFYPNEHLIKYWLFAYDKFFWRSNCFGLTLNLYPNNAEIKTEILRLINGKFKLYEWSSYFAFQTLSFSFKFSDQELRQEYLGFLQSETSDLVKISIYRLLIKHSKNEQFNVVIKRQLQKEKNKYLKILVTDFYKNGANKDVNMVEFLNSISL